MVVGKPPFQVLLDTHREEVFRFLVAAAGPGEADDCFQETFLSALRAYPRLRDGSNLRAWLLKIASNKAIDAHRSRQRRPAPADQLPEPASGPPPETDPALWGAVRALPPRQRASILHRYVSDLPYAEIGRVVGCSDEAARRNVHEGLKKLRGAWNA